MTWLRPPHISERENAHISPGGQYDDAADEDCLFCSGLSQYLGAHPGAAPATHDEAERLRLAAGLKPTGPANSLDLVRGTKARYGFEPTIIASGVDSLKQFLKPGMSATVSGKLSNFPKGHRLRRFYPYYLEGHRVRVDNMGAYLWWDDPGAPDGYTGEKVTWAEIATFVKGGASHTIAPLAEDGEVLPITDTTTKVVTATTGAVYYDPASGAVVTKESLPKRVVTSYYGSNGYRLVSIPTGGTVKLLGVKPNDAKVTITDAPPPPSEQQLAAARALGFAQGKEKATKAVESIEL